MEDTNNTHNDTSFAPYFIVVVVCTHCGYNNDVPDIENELGIVECDNCGFGFTPEE